jgi:exodeoxyribonuclease VII large subunit
MRRPPRVAPAQSRNGDLLGSDDAGAADGAPPRGPAVLPVSLLVSSARLLLERHLGLVWVSGEISNFTRAASGHCYFNLKDSDAQVRCVFFRHKAQFVDFALKDGLQVEVRATASIYEARGDFQLNVETMRLAGLGALYEQFARLKARLDAAGWFAAETKQVLPRFPRSVGIVTSTRAAALSDLLTTLARRWPSLRVIVYPTAVQGAGAAAEIAAAIRTANARAEVDVLIVARGGGSIEDLWAFNEEAVAQAVHESVLPVVSGVGHETDFTICDFVADVRAPTPTGAATLVAPDRHAVLRDVAGFATRWQRAQQRSLELRMQRVDSAARRLVHPAAKLAQQARDVNALAARLRRAMHHRLTVAAGAVAEPARRLEWRLRQPLPQAARLASTSDALRRALPLRLERAGTRLAALAQNLAHLNPQAVLGRGYALVTTADGAIVQDAAQVAPGDAVALEFARGGAAATITRSPINE